jgi:hypothetical protein
LSVLLVEVQKWRSLELALEKAPMFSDTTVDSFAPCLGTAHIPEKMAGWPIPPPSVRSFSGPTI